MRSVGFDGTDGIFDVCQSLLRTQVRTFDKPNEELTPNNGIQGTHNSGAALAVARP